MERAADLFERISAGGVAAIEAFIPERKAEELFLDFKRSSDDGADRTLSNIDRQNLARAISGFGNSEGGVVVWGFDCSLAEDGADVARSLVPLANARRFETLLQTAFPAARSQLMAASLSDPSKMPTAPGSLS